MGRPSVFSRFGKTISALALLGIAAGSFMVLRAEDCSEVMWQACDDACFKNDPYYYASGCSALEVSGPLYQITCTCSFGGILD